MSRPWWVQRLVSRRSPRPIARRKAQPQLTPLEDRSTPATVTYTAAGGILVFQGDAGKSDTVTVGTPAANTLVIDSTDTMTLAGDVAAGFTLSNGDKTLTIDTALKPATDFKLLLGDKDDTLTVGVAVTPSGVTNVTIDGEADSDLVTLAGVAPDGFVSATAETIKLTGNVLTDGKPITFAGSVVVDGPAIAVDSEQGVDSDAGTIALGGPISATTAGSTLLVDATGLGAGKSGGAISYIGFGNGGGAFLTDLSLDSRGTLASGVIAINGDITVTGDAVANTSSITIRGVAQMGASVSLNANDANLSGGAVDLSAVSVSATAAGNNLLIQASHTGGLAGTNGGAVTLGVFDAAGGATVNDVVVVTDTGGAGGTRGTVSFGGSLSIAGALNVTAGGVTQAGSTAVVVGGAATFDLAGGSVTLDNSANNFNTVAVANTTNATFRDTNAIGLAASTVTGTLSVTAGGSITQTGVVTAPTGSFVATGVVSAVMLNTSANAIGTVTGSSTAAFALTNAGGLAVGVGGIAGGGGISLTTQSTTAGQNLVVNGPLSSVAGAVSLVSGNSITVSSSLSAFTTIGVTIANGNAAGRDADLSAASLTAPGGVSLLGGNGADTFSVKATTTAVIGVNGGLPSTPPGDKLTIDAQGANTSDNGSTVSFVGFLPINYTEIETLNLLNVGAFTKIVDGTAAADTLVLRETAGVTEYSLNGAAFVAFVAEAFQFNGLGGADTMTVDFSVGPITLSGGIGFDGGAGGPDLLRLLGDGSNTGEYTPDAVVPGNGVASVDGVDITFTNLTPLDIVGMATYTVTLPGLADLVTLTQGVLFGDPTLDAIRVDATSGGVAIEIAAFRDIGELTIDTTTVELAANPDTVTVNAIDNAPLVDNLTIVTAPNPAVGTDVVRIAGTVSITGTLDITTNTTQLSANVTTGANQFYDAASIDLTTNVTTQSTGAGTIDFGGAVTGAFDLNVQTTGTGFFSGSVSVNSVATDAGGTTKVNGGGVTTSTTQTYSDAVVVGADATFLSTGGNDITFGSTLDGAFNVAVNTVGLTTFVGAVGVTAKLASLTTDAGGTTRIQGGAVQTTGTQTYKDAVTVTDVLGTMFFSQNGKDITFESTLDGPGAAKIKTTGVTKLLGAVGVGTPLAFLKTDPLGSVTIAGGKVVTTGDQLFNDGVTITANTEFQSTGGGSISFVSTLGGLFDVVVTTGGLTTFNGAVDVNALTTDGAGTTEIGTGTITTAATQTYNDPVALTTNVVFTSTGGQDISFVNTLDGTGGATVNTTGVTQFLSGVGGTTPLAFLTTNAGGTTTVAANVTTAGDQSYNDAVTLPVDVVFTSTGAGNIVFFATLDGPGGATINTTGTTGFGGKVGNTTALGFLTTNAGGTTAVSGLVRTTGAQTFGDGVTITVDTLFTATAGGITFASTLTGAGKAATLDTPGLTTLSGAVSLGSLTSTGGGQTTIGAATVTTSATQTYADAVVLTANVTFTSTGGGDITFASTLDGTGGATVNTAGTTLFGAAVGGGVPLAFLKTDAPGATTVAGGLVRTTLEQTYLDGVTAAANTTFTSTGGGAITFAALTATGKSVDVNTAGTTTFGGPVTAASLATDAGGTTTVTGGTITTTAFQAYGDAVTLGANFAATAGTEIFFASTLDGPGGLTATTTTKTTVFGAIGGTTPLAFLEVVGGDAYFVGGSVRTAGIQKYNSSVFAYANTVFTASGSDITFVQQLQTPNSSSVEVRTTGVTTFGGAVSAAALVTDAGGTTRIGGPTITTSGAQSYNDAVFLIGNTTFTGSAITFTSLDGPAGITSASPVTVGGAIGAITPLAFINLSGAVTLSGGVVQTTGAQTYGSPLSLTRTTTFTSTGGADITFGTVNGIGNGIVVNTAGVTRFNGPVVAGSLETDAPGSTVIAGGSITTTGAQTYRDAVSTTAATTFAGGSVSFLSTLSNACLPIVVNSPGVTVFGGPVDVGSVTTDAPGTTTISGGSMKTCTFQDYGDPVTLTANTDFASTGDLIRFRQLLTGPAARANLITSSFTTFLGPVVVETLTTDLPGTTEVNGGSVTANQITFGDPVTVGANTTFTSPGAVDFNKTLSGPFAVTLATGETIFRGDVSVGTLTATGAGQVVIASPLTVATTKFTIAGPVVLVGAAPVTFIATQNSTFNGAVSGPSPVTISSSADVAFNGSVAINNLTTDAGGRTVVRTPTLQTDANQTYGDAVVIAAASGVLSSIGGNIVFNGSLNAETAGVQSVTVQAPAGEVQFNGLVGNPGAFAALAVNGKSIRVAADVRVVGDTLFTLQGGELLQAAGSLLTDTLGFAGFGTYRLEQGGNDVRVALRANVGSEIFVTDANDLAIDQSKGGLVTNNGDVFLTINGDFIFQDTRPEAEQQANPLINLGTGTLFINVTGPGPRTVIFNGEVIAAKVFLGIAGGQNAGADEFSVRPSVTTPFFVFGNDPVGGVGGDSLLALFKGLSITGFNFNGQDGFFDFGGRARITFSGIESIEQLSIFGYVVQTTEPRDGTRSNVIESVIQVRANIGGQLVNEPLENPGFPENPFVVTPARVNPAGPSSAPRIAFGDFNGDGRKDMAIANGPGTSPRITIVDLAFIFTPLGSLPTVLPVSSVLAEFFAYDPSFTGGVNIAAGDLDGDGIAEIVTGADVGGGAHIRTFSLKAPSANVGTPYEAKEIRGANGEMLPFSSFIAYESTFRGGVRVAVGDVNGDGRGDLVYAAAALGGPRVTVRDGKTAATLGDFFAYDPNFRGGLYVDAGDFNNDGKADILTGPGEGGGAHIRVFDGVTISAAPPTILREFFAFDASLPNGALSGSGGQYAGVGGVSFGAFDISTRRTILVSTPRGLRTRVVSILTDSNPATPVIITNLTANSKFRVPNDPSSPIPPVILTADQLTYGASVGGFAEISS